MTLKGWKQKNYFKKHDDKQCWKNGNFLKKKIENVRNSFIAVIHHCLTGIINSGFILSKFIKFGISMSISQFLIFNNFPKLSSIQIFDQIFDRLSKVRKIRTKLGLKIFV